VTERSLVWDGCVNVRDLGGHATPTGETRFGSIVRADALEKLSDAGWRALVDHGVRTVVDLRTHGERNGSPPPDVQVTVVHVSVLPEFDWEGWAAIDEAADREPDPARATVVVYLEFLERWGSEFARAIREVADAPEGGVLVHCQGGKDRTGLVSALLLRLAGVSLEQIGEDYALSGENLRDEARVWIDAAPEERERARRERMSQTHAASMVAVLEELERRHGGAAGFLRDNGLDDATIERARSRLAP
jgi:protein tyrosine/serine phosphatase